MSSHVRERVSRVETSQIKMPARPFGLSLAELLAAAAVLIFFVLIITFYFTSVKPEQDHLRDLEAQHNAQQSVIDASLKNNTGGANTTQDMAKEALDSLNTFKSSHLTSKQRARGEAELFKEINALAKKHNLQLMSGIEVRPNVEPKSNQKNKSMEQSMDVFPKLDIHFSVFGQFTNLRAFIHELERNNHYLVIETLSLTSVEAEEGRRSRNVQTSSGISLAIDMTAYFQS